MVIAVGLTLLPGRWKLTLGGLFILAQVYGVTNYLAGRQFLNPNYCVQWKQVAAQIQRYYQPHDYIIAYYEASFFRYWRGPQQKAINVNEITTAAQMEPVERFAEHGNRVWLVTRDRGGEYARRLAEQLRRRLARQAAAVKVFSFMPLTRTEQYYRSLLLRRRVWDAYIKVYLFIPPSARTAGRPSPP